MQHPTDRIAHTTTFVIPVVEHWLEVEIAQWVHHEVSTRRPIAPRANALTTELHLAPPASDVISDEGRKEENVLFNDALNTFYLRLYGVKHMVKDHCDSEKGNPLPPHSRGALAGTRNSSMGPPHEGSIRRPIAT